MPGGYYIVMEYVNGISLANFISYHRIMKLRVPEALDVFIVSRIARGLAYAHKRRDKDGNALGIVLRDVCPNNILISTEGLPKLADFGVAKVAKSALLGDGLIVGKLVYMAPEQAQKKSVDYRADIFSLGAVFFELLTCEPIREVSANTTISHANKIAQESIPWKHLPSSTHKDVAAMLHKMLALDPKDRYQDTDTLAHALEYFIYRDGYGPTIQTLEHYLREHFSFLYALRDHKAEKEQKEATTVIPSPGFFKHPHPGRDVTALAPE
jgi:serine/threonine protein kinase